MTHKIKIITHDRVVHADDAMAAAILRMTHSEVEVIRTRDPAILREESGKPGSFLIDVGGKYDPARGLFDHHQPEGAGFRNQAAREWPYATAGLVWKEYGAAAVRALHPTIDSEGVQEIVDHIDDSVLKYIDAIDCGVRVRTAGPSLSALIASFNTSWYEPEEDVFPLVLDLAQVLLTNFIKRHAGKVLARDKVRKAATLMDGRVMLLDTCLPWVTVVADEMPDVQFVAYPVGDTELEQIQWQLRAAVQPDMVPRVKFPMSWAGLERDALAAACGEPSAVFCHRNRHLAGASSLEGIMNMAQEALREVDQDARDAMVA